MSNARVTTNAHDDWQRRDFLKFCSLGFAAGTILRSRIAAAYSHRSKTDVEWPREVQQPPLNKAGDVSSKWEPLLQSADGKQIDPLEAWRVQRNSLRDRLRRFLGPLPTARPPLRLAILAAARQSG